MKANFTYLRNCISVVLLSLSLTTAFSQTSAAGNPEISNLKATVVNNNIVINWNVTDAIVSNYCEVQASKDGVNFSTIGYVLGADPKQDNNGFAFKQSLSKIKAGQVYFRVLTIGSNDKAFASNVVKTSN